MSKSKRWGGGGEGNGGEGEGVVVGGGEGEGGERKEQARGSRLKVWPIIRNRWCEDLMN